MRTVVFAIVGALGLAACNANQPPVVGAQRVVAMGKQPAAGTLNPTGNATIVDLANGDRATRINLSGLAPNTSYVAHYHKQGDMTKPPCESGGALIPTSTMIGKSDASGVLVMRGNVARDDVADATYLNVHTAAADMSTMPADAGVSCGNLK
ncbi:hypothetical protein [Deinococcus pimensis]|uniref:hypothetical protein n=1 Tax=Deinococcus pimensis TaxID=309888 RepID=UPI0004815029|nr:hypothetical protein [Deinococcus pimensis]